MAVFSWKTTKKKVKKGIYKAIKYVSYKWVLPVEYKWYARRPLNERLVLFADHRDRELQDNFKDIYRMCQEEGFECVVMTGQKFGSSVPFLRRQKEKILFHLRFTKLFAQCRCLFLVDYFPPAYTVAKPREGTQVVQLWHACGIMKKIGHSAIDKPWGMTPKEENIYHPHNNYTLVCASSDRCKETFADAFRCSPDIIKPLGCPRTDIYYDKDFVVSAREKVLEMFPQIGTRRIVLYAPTYRGNSARSSHMEMKIDVESFCRNLGEEYVLLVKFHPVTAKRSFPASLKIKGKGTIFDVSNLLTPEIALCAADILITDFSTIYYEYLLLERPIISYIYDIDKYISDRGLYFPYDELAPGPYVFDNDSLLETIRSVDEWFDIERTRSFKAEFMSGCDGHSTQRIFDYVFHNQTMENGEAI